MARYDRIAPIKAPTRDQAFPGWLVLRDLVGRERDTELARRARLRFLALRPVRRLLARGLDGVATESYERQIEGVREELGHLSARDPERLKLAAYLHRIREKRPAALAGATLEIGDVTEAAGHYFAAEEYFLTSLELASAHGLKRERIAAQGRLARVCRKTARWTEAERHARAAADLALELRDHEGWAQAMADLGLGYRAMGESVRAREVFTTILERGKDWAEDAVVATAAANLCLLELTVGDLDRAVELGWLAFGLERDDAERFAVLDQLGTAFTRLRLYRAAERCYQVIANRSAHAGTRVQARALHAAVAAEAGDAQAFRERRERLGGDLTAMQGEPGTLALVHLDLGRGALRIGDIDFARDHLREAIVAAKKRGSREILARAAELLTELEATSKGEAPPARAPRPAGERARRIAVEIEALDATLVPASG